MFNHTIPAMKLELSRLAFVFTDLQNDFLSPTGLAFPLLEKSFARNGTVENLEKLLKVANEIGLPIFISPHYYFYHDSGWQAPLTPLEDLAHKIGLVSRVNPISEEGFEGSGADFPERYKSYLQEGDVVICSPHKAYGASTNDVALQLRRRRIEQIILAGPVGNLCVEAHMRDFIELGFEVAMVRDATAGTTNEEGDGYAAALINWRFMAHAMWTADEVVNAIKLARP